MEGRAGDNLDWHAARRADPDAAYKHLVDAATSPRSRREYPEVSFSWIGDMVNGTMGVNPLFTSPLQAAVKGNWVEVAVRTMPALASHVSWAELRHLPIRANGVAVRHEGNRKTRFTNQRGPALVWQAAFDGRHETLLVNGRPMKATVENSARARFPGSTSSSAPAERPAWKCRQHLETVIHPPNKNPHNESIEVLLADDIYVRGPFLRDSSPAAAWTGPAPASGSIRGRTASWPIRPPRPATASWIFPRRATWAAGSRCLPCRSKRP